VNIALDDAAEVDAGRQIGCGRGDDGVIREAARGGRAVRADQVEQTMRGRVAKRGGVLEDEQAAHRHLAARSRAVVLEE